MEEIVEYKYYDEEGKYIAIIDEEKIGKIIKSWRGKIWRIIKSGLRWTNFKKYLEPLIFNLEQLWLQEFNKNLRMYVRSR